MYFFNTSISALYKGEFWGEIYLSHHCKYLPFFPILKANFRILKGTAANGWYFRDAKQKQ